MNHKKIRVFDKIRKRMVQVGAVFTEEGMFREQGADEYDVFSFNTEYFSELMETTGMVDKNGVEIYCGDYVTNGSIDFYEVVYQAPCYVMKKPLKNGLSKTWRTFIRAPHENQFVTVIGNKYE